MFLVGVRCGVPCPATFSTLVVLVVLFVFAFLFVSIDETSNYARVAHKKFLLFKILRFRPMNGNALFASNGALRG